MNLYLLMTALFMGLAVLAAVDTSLTSFSILPWFNGLRWLRVHLITLGAMTEALYGLLPVVVLWRAGRRQPAPGQKIFRWDIWLLLNGGILTLLVAIPIINQALIFSGGLLIFAATLLLINQLRGLHAADAAQSRPSAGRKFYIAGLAFFLLGIIVGTGLWLGWSDVLQIKVPVEVHIHANNWGFMSLVFAGLLVDLFPRWSGRPLAWPWSEKAIFWMMTVGAVGLVLGPWFKSNYFSVPGLLLHLSATIWLLLNVARPALADPALRRRPGIWHLLSSYFWILAPILVAPLIILGVPGFPGAGVEQSAPQALIYGWVLQFGFALLPYFFRRAFLPGEAADLGGSWFSLTAVHLGGLFLWASIFIDAYSGLLHGMAYVLWAVAIVPIAVELWQIIRRRLDVEERQYFQVPADAAAD